MQINFSHVKNCKVVCHLEADFMLDLKTMIARLATDAKLNRVKLALNRNERSIATEYYRQQFDGMKWGLTFTNDKIIVPTKLRRRLLDTLHFGHAGTTKLASQAKTFLWLNISREIEGLVKNCTEYLASGKKLCY